MVSIVGLFKSGIPCKNRVYDELKLKKKKNNYRLLLEFKDILLGIDENNVLSRNTINNIFIFLMDNLKYSNFSDARNILNFLNSIQSSILSKIECIDKKIGPLYKNYRYILYHIRLFKCVISESLNLNVNILDAILRFENVSNEILNKKNLKKSISIINKNIDILSFHNRDGVGFEDLLFDRLSKSILYEDIIYYKQILKHLINISIFRIDPDRFKQFLTSSDKNKSVIDNKIASLEYCQILDRYIIKKDFIVSIDNKDTLKIDDALSVEKINDESYLIGIHIADVYSLGYDGKILTGGGVTSNKPINKKDASLTENKNRNTVTLFVEINFNGVIKDYRLVKTIISVNQNVSYEDVSAIFSNNISTYNKLKETINVLSRICDVLSYDGNIKLKTINEMGHLIIKKFMTLYGCLIAEYFYTNNIPCIYLNNSNGSISYTLDNPNYETYIKNYHKYVRATSPIYDKLSLLTQSLIYTGYFSELDEDTKNIIRLQLGKETEKLNNNRLQ